MQAGASLAPGLVDLLDLAVVGVDAGPALLDGRWQPMTGRLAFFEAPPEQCVQAWLSVRGAYLERTTGCRPAVTEVRGDVEELLSQLLPLVTISARRSMFVPIAGDGPYRCCLFTDAAYAHNDSARGWLQQSGIGSAEIISTAGDPRDPDEPEFHARMLRILKAASSDVTEDQLFRTVGIRMTGVRRWAFDDVGQPLPFEDVARYRRRRTVDRFSAETLVEYCAALALRPFDEDFYATDRRALVVEPTNPPYAGTRLLSLEDVREPDHRVRRHRTGVPHPDAPP